MPSQFALAAEQALKLIGIPSEINTIWATIQKDVGLSHKSRKPKQTLRNEIRKNCRGVAHIAPGNSWHIFTTPKRGFYGLVAWDDVARLLPEELSATSHVFQEGASKKIIVNRYERDPKARLKCLEHWGRICQACLVPLESIYGPCGKNYIQVHHTTPLSTVGAGYQPDPINDLVPVCPNCHAMLHTENPPMTINHLRTRIAEAKKLNLE